MIKKVILGLGVFVLSILGFSKSAYIGHYGVLQDSVYNNIYQLQINGLGNLLTQNIGLGKRIFYVNDGVYFAWSSDSRPYIYVTSDPTNPKEHAVQGYVDTYALCDYIGLETGAASPINCNFYQFNDYSGSVTRFMSGLSDYYYYDYYNSNVPNRGAYCGGFVLCFGNNNYNKSMCFYGTNGDFKYPCVYPEFFPDYDINLSSSQNLSPSFELIDNSFLGSSPGDNGLINGSSDTVENVYLTGNLSFDNSCTNGYVINYVNKIMGGTYINVCYAGTYNTGLIDNNFQGERYIYNYGLTLRELFQLTSDGMSYKDRFYSYSDEIKRFKKGSVAVNPFLSRPIALYSYFDNLYDGGFLGWGNDVDLLGPSAYNYYCNLVLYSDYSSSYSGSYFSSICDNISINPSGTYEYNSSSGNVVSVSWNGVLSGDNNKDFDGKSFINEFYQKLIKNFQKPTEDSGNGIIPSYILVFLVAIILFRFLRK